VEQAEDDVEVVRKIISKVCEEVVGEIDMTING